MQNGKMQNGKFELITTCGNARRGRMHTVHGEIETPVFMNVGTAAAIRGGAGTDDLRRSAVRWSFPTHITCIFVRVMSLYAGSAVCTNS